MVEVILEEEIGETLSTQVQLGTLRQYDIRDVWKDEARDFTPWLLNNVEELSAAIGLDLELHQAEHPVGRFSLDLIGVIAGTQDRVIIENQLDSSDHKHFGQLLTYAGGTDAKYVIWIAREFRDEYLSAIKWLNDGTTDDINFFAIEVSAVKIGDSLPAPLFKVVSQPNEWSKEAKASASALVSGGRGQKQLEFWDALLEALNAKNSTWTKAKKGRAQSWLSIASGVSNISYTFSVTKKQKKVEVVFWSEDRDLNEYRFETLKKRKDEIEAAFGNPLEWHFPDDNKQPIIRFTAPADFDDEAKWPSVISWLIENHTKMRGAFASQIDSLR